ncbi:MAG: carbohydrate ABC transporter permease [Candidatus Eremiobacteraeota bacterium]|nr:carbohydrate ABC transporter permease [Candidatus Eremiobacteraeota bacterium]
MMSGRLFAPVAAVFLAAVVVLPMLWIVLTSFKTFVQSQAIPPVWPSLSNVGNYLEALGGDQSALPPLEHSLIVATATMIVTTLIGIPAAYALARYDIPRKKDIQFYILSTRFMPIIAGIVPLSALLTKVGLAGSTVGLIVVYVSINLSFSVWLLTIFFRNVPKEVEEAARIDGASRLATLWVVTIPMASASIIVVALFTWIFSWNELLDALVLTNGDSQTLPVYLSKFASNTLTQYQQMAAVATVQTLPAILLTFFAQKYIVTGLSMGALSAE